MLPSRRRLDPEGYYDRLGLEPAAEQTEVAAAFRAKARVLHPDVPGTGNTAAFVAAKQAYDVLSNRERRQAYDAAARQAAFEPAKPEPVIVRPASYAAAPRIRHPRFSDLPVAVWVGVGAFFSLCLYEVASHLLTPARPVTRVEIRPNAATVQPLSPGAHRAVLYGPTPVRLPGTPNFYIVPGGNPTILWRMDAERNTMVSLGQLPPFSSVQAIQLIRQTGMLEVLVNEQGHGFISANHLAKGDAAAARAAYCGYNAGPVPFDGEVLEHRGHGAGKLAVENRAMQPAVLKLRDEAGAVALEVFLGPGGHADLADLPDGLYRPEFAIGELWSRACNVFAAGMRARRMEDLVRLPGNARIVVSPDTAVPAASDISDQAFGRD
jgi:hypothetical protein